METKAAPPVSKPPVRPALERAVIADLTSPTPGRLLCAALIDWALIIGAAAVSIWIDHLAFTVLAVAFIATRQHALAILIHEFSHRNFSRNWPRLNDALGDFLTALPFFATVHGFRRDHAPHHSHTGTQGDPVWAQSRGKARYTFPMSRPRMAWTLLKFCAGAYTPGDLKGFLFDSKMATACPPATKVRQALFIVAAIGLTTWFHAWSIVAIYWFLPFLTGMMMLLYWREVGEHFGLPQGKAPTRTLLLNRFERWLIAPHHVHFHAEHHLHPAVPAFHLPALHRLLREHPPFVEQTVFTRGYLGLLRELSGRP
jgi:fatty acid desaturase